MTSAGIEVGVKRADINQQVACLKEDYFTKVIDIIKLFLSIYITLPCLRKYLISTSSGLIDLSKNVKISLYAITKEAKTIAGQTNLATTLETFLLRDHHVVFTLSLREEINCW